MSSDSIPLRPPMTRDAAGTLLGQTMGLVAVTAALFAVGAYLGRTASSPWGWLGFIAAFGCLIGMNVAAQRSEGLTVLLLFGFGLLIGVATAPTPTGPWTDSGAPVVGPRRGAGASGDFKWTFDPSEFTHLDGTRYLYYGSYYGGIFVTELSEAGVDVIADTDHVALARHLRKHLVRRPVPAGPAVRRPSPARRSTGRRSA